MITLESTVLVAPSCVVFDVAVVPPASNLVYTIGMPLYEKSNGMDYSLSFDTARGRRLLNHEHMVPAGGRRWQVRKIPLDDFAGEHGSIILSAEVDGSGNADADWVAFARARLCERGTEDQDCVLDFGAQLRAARIEPVAGTCYWTEGNVPVFPMSVRLEQEPAAVLVGKYDYRPKFPVRMLDAGAHAGFWCMSWGMLPFSVAGSDSALESIRVYEVIRPVDAYGESPLTWYKR